jgi:1,4-alpha-glucan branching enzyme
MPINRAEVGARVTGTTVSFGLYLPDITAGAGFQVNARIIHAADQFRPEIPAVNVPLAFDASHALGLWSVSIDVTSLPSPTGSRFGQPGDYLYRFELLRQGRVVTKVFLDPFATQNGPGLLSVFQIGPVTPFAWTDGAYTTPRLDELIIYELNVAQFYGSFDGVVARLDYLEGLGVNCLELMPITPVKTEFDWGYGPIGYFAPEDYLGGPLGLKRLVNAAHARGIAVILDVVYGHADAREFPYSGVYDDAGVPNPMMQTPNRDGFGRGFEHALPLAREYCLEANKHFLDEYHVDGFRYDNIRGYYDDNPLTQYGTLAFATYVHSRTIPRFADPAGFRRILQIAEDLDNPARTLRDTFSNSSWQDHLLNKAEDMARWGYVDDNFAHLLDPYFGDNFPTQHDATPAGDAVSFPSLPLQYLSSHDHSWLITKVALLPPLSKDDIRFGDRSRFYELQPFAIALLSSRGVPMLWEGEELAENYEVAGGGNLRISFLRGMHWEYFYDEAGSALVRVYRRMGKLRRALPALRGPAFFYYNVQSRPPEGLIAIRRSAPGSGGSPEQHALVILNFSNAERTVTLPAPRAGTYREMLDRLNRPAGSELELTAAAEGDGLLITVPSHYGRVFVSPVPTTI